jgi:hypothetical protein
VTGWQTAGPSANGSLSLSMPDFPSSPSGESSPRIAAWTRSLVRWLLTR